MFSGLDILSIADSPGSSLQRLNGGSVKISQRTVKTLGKIVTGDASLSPYRSGPQLVELFNNFGSNDTYAWSGGFPSRWAYAEEKINELNGDRGLGLLVEHVLDPREFLGTEFEITPAMDYLNEFLVYDGYRVLMEGRHVRVRKVAGAELSIELPQGDGDDVQFIGEQLDKCDRKVAEGDYDGAITNARSLIEAVLLKMMRELGDPEYEHRGDLPRLYKDVSKVLHLEPRDVVGPLHQILRGMISIIQGLAELRNKMSDSHTSIYRPAEHHAVLAVNAAKTLTDFVFQSREYQEAKGLLSHVGKYHET